MNSVVFIIGTRPEAIKLAPIIIEARKHSSLNVLVLTSGQHKHLLSGALNSFQIKPDLELETEIGATLSESLGQIIIGVSRVLSKLKPSLVVVHGDTNTTLGGAIAAFHLQIPIAHVESGLRTGNLYSPFPEEMNRTLLAKIANLNFSPTPLAEKNLTIENVPLTSIFTVGNTAVDSVKIMLRQLEVDVNLRLNLAERIKASSGFDCLHQDFALVTLHRRENVDKYFDSVLGAIAAVARRNPKFRFFFPVHPNPIILNKVNGFFTGLANVVVSEPLDYQTFTLILRQCKFILTDSGGIQEEAISIKKPVLIARASTERPEVLTNGGTLLSSESSDIEAEIEKRILFPNAGSQISGVNPFGEGNASHKIVAIIEEFLEQNPS